MAELSRDAIFIEEAAGALGSIDLEAALNQQAGRLKEIHFLLSSTCGHQHASLRDPLPYGKHRLEECLGGTVGDTAHLSGGHHIHSQDRIGSLETREGKLRRLDTDIVEIKYTLLRLVVRLAEHNLRGEGDEIHLEHFRDEGEGARGSEVALDHLDLITTSEVLHVEWSGDIERLRDLAGDALDAPHCLNVDLLPGELDGGIAGVYAGEFDMLTNRIGDQLPLVRHCIHLDLLCILHKVGDHHGVLLRDIRGKTEEALKLLLIGADIHRCTTEDIGGTYKNRIADLIDKVLDIVK